MPSYKTHDPKGWCGDMSRGAALGRPSVHDGEPEGKMTLRRVHLDPGGYDENGTYFGAGSPLFWYADEGGNVDDVLRARDRVEARELVLVHYPDADITVVDSDDFIEQMFHGYVEAALWSTNDNSDPETGGDPLDANYEESDIAPESLATLREHCERFYRDNEPAILLADYSRRSEHTNAEMVGHDLWLTANGHGCGFWDGDLPEDLGQVLTRGAKQIGETDLYAGDDGKVYVS